MEAKNMIKLLGISVIAVMFLLPSVSASITAGDADVSLSVRGGLKGVKYTVTNNEPLPVEVTYRIIGITIFNISRKYDLTNTSTISENSKENIAVSLPSDFAIIYAELKCEGQKIYKFGFAFNGIVLLPWSDN